MLYPDPVAAIDFPVLFSDFFRLFFTAVTEGSFMVVILNLRMKLWWCKARWVIVSGFWLFTIFVNEPSPTFRMTYIITIASRTKRNAVSNTLSSCPQFFPLFWNTPEPPIAVTNLWWTFRLIVSRLSMNSIRYNVNPLARPKFFSFVVAELQFFDGRRVCTRQGFFSRFDVTTKNLPNKTAWGGSVTGAHFTTLRARIGEHKVWPPLQPM